MRFKQATPVKAVNKYRCYSPSVLTSAYQAVKEQNMSVRRVSIQYGVPMQTLRDRVTGKVDFETVRSGPQPLFSAEEEVIFIKHLKYMASLGYGYTGTEVIEKASQYAVYLGKRSKSEPVTEKWYRGLKSRWPELKTITPRALAKERAQSTSEEVVLKYFKHLDQTLTLHNLKDKPECVYNFDEKGVQTENRPPKVLVGSGPVPAITSARSSITTILGCGNALGTQIPPYFIFKGHRMSSELFSDATPGASGIVSETGWSNGDTFMKYLDEHFLKFIQRSNSDQPILLIFDGHRSHINISTLDWAKRNNVILFVLPAYTSHLLQPLDVGCFGPFQRIYNSECHKCFRSCPESWITRYNVCKLASTAYTAALSPTNLRSSFEKTGIFPFNPDSISPENLVPAKAYQTDLSPEKSQPLESCKDPTAFFTADTELILEKQKYESKKEHRETLTKSLSGTCITEPNTENEIIKFLEGSKKKKKSSPQSLKPNKKHKSSKCDSIPQPQPGPSKPYTGDMDIDDSDSDEILDEEKCCVCHKFEPEELKYCVSLVLTKWAQCDFEGCGHWTHLKYCCKQTVIRHNGIFECPYHQNTEE